jgi:pimeloyl-ACP methyl ester carboxylesterase
MEKGNEKKKGVLVNRTKTNRITTYNEIHGDGPPLVLIHGVSLDHNHNIKNPIVCGLSMGGMIAQMFAVKYPAQLRALIIADSAAKFMVITLQEKF